MAATRKPVDQTGNPREMIWAAIRKTSSGFTVASIADCVGSPPKTVRCYLTALAAAGYLAVMPDEPGQPARWVLVRDIGNEAPRVRPDGSPVTQGQVTEQLWRGMYMLKEFSFRDLIETASIKIPEDAARAYCKLLLATGYLRVLRKAEPTSGRIARYRLVRNNGPKPPQVQRVKRVYDPNSGEVFVPEDHI